MAKDKPAFLQNVGDDEEEREVLSVFEDEEQKGQSQEETSKETTQSENILSEDTSPKKEQQTKEIITEKENNENKSIKETNVKEESTESKPLIKEKSVEKKTEEEKKPEEKLYMGKYKTAEDLEKAYVELQRAFSKLQENVKKAGISTQEDDLAVFRKTPVIRPTIPDPTRYYFKNEEGEEVLDLQSYMKDAFNNFAISIQQSLLGGPLASAVFSLLSQAVNEEHSSVLEEAKREEEAISIWNKIQETYPILGKDERLQALFERAIYGEKQRRLLEAQQTGKEYADMTLDDYLNLAKELIGSQQINVPPQPQENVEKPRGDVALSEKSRFTSDEKQLNSDIDAMMALKRKSLF